MLSQKKGKWTLLEFKVLHKKLTNLIKTRQRTTVQNSGFQMRKHLLHWFSSLTHSLTHQNWRSDIYHVWQSPQHLSCIPSNQIYLFVPVQNVQSATLFKVNLVQSVISCKVLNNVKCLIKQSAPLCRVPISYNFHFAYCCTLLSFALCIVILFAQFCTVHCFLIDLVHLRTDSQSC